MLNERLELEKNVRELRRNLLAKDCSDIPKLEAYSKMNFIPIQPIKPSSRNLRDNNTIKRPQKDSKMVQSVKEVSELLIDTEYEKPVRSKLREIYTAQLKRFNDICKKVIDMKFLSIYEEIYKFMLFMKFCEEPFLRTIVLNTDQNANEFFESMENFISSKFEENTQKYKRVIYIEDSYFKDMKGLFKLLEITPGSDEFENKDEEKIERLVVIREIQKVDKVNFNILIRQLIDYHQNIYRLYTNIIIFDVSYDPRGLFDKIKPNHLCKMSFSNVENIPSRNIYQEVLYKYIFSESDNLFIPHPVNLKKIVDHVSNHQISVKSFKHYFKFLIIHFFLIESWKGDEYLMYDSKLDSCTTDEELGSFFGAELAKLYGSKSRIFKKEDIHHLVKRYIENKRNLDLFFTFYKFFESRALEMKYASSATNEERYQFFFEFLQFGEDLIKTTECRVNVIKKYFGGRKNFDYYNWIKDRIHPELLDLINGMEEIEEDKDKESQIGTDSLETIKGVLDNLGKKLFSRSKRKKNDDMDIDLPGCLTSEQYLDKFLKWLGEEFFTLQCFSYINFSVNRKMHKSGKRIVINAAKNYINFLEIVNPSPSAVVMNILSSFGELMKEGREKLSLRKNRSKYADFIDDTLHLITEDNFSENYNLPMIYKQFIILYGHAPSEFRLKYLFVEFLRQYSIDFENNKDWVESMKLHFLYFCHVFYLLGFISRKASKSDKFIKNYFDLKSYFVKDK